MQTIRWLQISDIHILKKDPEWDTYQTSLIDYLVSLKVNPDFLVLTGDYHNILQSHYNNALQFINTVIRTFRLDPQKDVFLVPGNHDTKQQKKQKILKMLPADPRKEELSKLLPKGLAPWNKAKKTDEDQDWLQKHEHDPVNYIDRLCGVKRDTKEDRECVNLQTILNGFDNYGEFARDICAWYRQSGTNPSVPHLREWKNEEGNGFNIVHLNTAIVADGSRSHYQALDLNATTGLLNSMKHSNLPTLVLAHNSFYDLHPKIQRTLLQPLANAGVCAWLCGDAHRFSIEKKIQLAGPDVKLEIPIFVCGKGAPDNLDNWSNYGVFYYESDCSVATAHLVKWDKAQGCRPVLPTVSFSLPQNKRKILIGYLSCNPDIPLRDKYHLGHALFISKMDERVDTDTTVLLISSFVRPNRGSITKTEDEKAYVDEMMRHWCKCFQNKAVTLDITHSFDSEKMDDLNGQRLVCYLSRFEFLLANNQAVQEIIKKWAESNMVSEGNLASIKDFFEVDHSRNYSTDEIMSFAYLLYRKPTWYSISWLHAFLFFWNNKLYSTLHSQTSIDTTDKEIYIFESRRNHYVWDAISYCAKRFDYSNFPKVEYYETLLDTNCQKPMKSSNCDAAFFLKDYEDADKLSPEFTALVKGAFHTNKSIKEIAKQYYDRLGLDDV